MMKARRLGTILWTALLLSPALSDAEVFQWTDARGVLHFADNLHSVPEALRNSPQLVIRQDLAPRDKNFEASNLPEGPGQEPAPEEKLPKATSPADREPANLPRQVVHYNPQQTTIVVVNHTTIVRPPKDKICASEGCKPVFQPNFNDRRYIHPSVFDGGSRQYLQPESSQSSRR